MNPTTDTVSMPAAQAQRMMDAFTSIGANRFHVTFINIREEQTEFFKNRTVPSMRYNLPAWVKRAGERKPVMLPATDDEPETTVLSGENLIIRPYAPPPVALVQLDDLEQKQLERVRPAAFLVLQTSPGNYQAWVAVRDGDRDFTARIKRKTGADLSASGSVRLAGTGNFKRKYAPEFPTVTIDELHLGRVMTREQLEGMGLAAPAPAKAAPPASPLRCSSDRPRSLAWPDWNRCLEEMLAKGKKRSAADYYFACIASGRPYKRTPEEIADRLMQISSKAVENGYDYALGQAIRAAERVAANPYSRSR